MAGIDRPDEPGVPPDGHADRRDDQGGSVARAGRSGGNQPETRSREECYWDLRVAEALQKSTAVRQTAAAEQARLEKWTESAEESRWMWSEYQRKWPPEECPQVDRSKDPPGAWSVDRDKLLNRDENSRIEAACDRIADLERDKISSAMRAIESQDPDRHLVGFDHRLKEPDRIKEKIYDGIRFLKRSPEEAVSLVPDAIRFTFEYREAYYTQGVWADLGRLKDQGFELIKLRNAWSEEQYKGINGQWLDRDTGQRFEVQFHTHISFEAKQLTHKAYERLRTHQADAFEELVLEAFQRKVTAEVPVPLGATDIPDYSKRDTDAR